jgi:hypothetical protein
MAASLETASYPGPRSHRNPGVTIFTTPRRAAFAAKVSADVLAEVIAKLRPLLGV